MKTEDFLLDDYKLKVEYYTGHLSRMWTRFNFLLTIDSALLGLFAAGDVAPAICPLLPFVGMTLSTLWCVFSAFDLSFTRRYTRHIKCAYCLLANKINDLPAGYAYADETEVRWPLRYVSPLYMSVLLPLGFLGVWLGLWLTGAMCP
jgi:hypothetical protein